MRKISKFVDYIQAPKIFLFLFLKGQSHCTFTIYNSVWEGRCEQGGSSESL